jgi:hypothetical protein
MTASPAADPFAHILSLTDRHGTFEHADGAQPRREHGFCLDDVARVLLVAVREPDPSTEVRDLARSSIRFIADAQGVDGTFRNRRDVRGRWHGRRGVEDCWGRAMWALGVAAVRGEPWLRQDAKALFDHGAQQRSPHLRAMAFAALGAGSLLAADPDHRPSRRLLEAATTALTESGDPTPAWPWPQARLTYANAVLPDALVAAGAALERPALLERGLALLDWLSERETRDGHLSVTPAAGAGPDDDGPAFAQQPIEVATLAEACARAFRVTGDQRWATGVRMAAAWFDGDNDLGVVMWDPATGGGFDGLEPNGPNRNQGAESSLALLATRQHAGRLVPASR